MTIRRYLEILQGSYMIRLLASWEGFTMETVALSTGKDDHSLFFWATHTGAEVDLFWIEAGKACAVECKYAEAGYRWDYSA